MTALVPVKASATLALLDSSSRFQELFYGWLLTITSERTKSAYIRDFDLWVQFLTEWDVELLAVNPDHVNAYRRVCEAAGLSPATVARRLAVVSSFYNHCLERDAMVRNPAKVRRPKLDPDHSSTVGLTQDEAQRLIRQADKLALEATKDRTRKTAARDAAIIALMLCTGGRVSEVCHARIEDLGYDRGHRVLFVTRKGGKRQSIALGESAAVIDRHVAVEERTKGTIFVTRSGKPVDRAYVFRVIRKVALLAHIPAASKLSPHSLRHTFATLALDAGVTLDDLQDAMGHADPRTTRRYDRARNRIDRSPVHVVSRALLGGK